MSTVGSETSTTTVKVDDKLSLGLSRTKTNSKRLGVMSITKAENVQLGLLLKYIATNETVYQALETHEVLQFPDAFKKLCGRYST